MQSFKTRAWAWLNTQRRTLVYRGAWGILFGLVVLSLAFFVWHGPDWYGNAFVRHAPDTLTITLVFYVLAPDIEQQRRAELQSHEYAPLPEGSIDNNFGVSQAQIDAIIAYMHAQGLHNIDTATPHSPYIQATATISQAEKILGQPINYYATDDGQEYLNTPTSTNNVPFELQDKIIAISSTNFATFLMPRHSLT